LYLCRRFKRYRYVNHIGEMAERLNAAVLKTVDLLRDPGVRIPLSPQNGVGLGVIVWVCFTHPIGGMAERLNAADSKSVVLLRWDRGFESLSLRKMDTCLV
jgi:hypothetical protein